MVEIVALARALADAGEHRKARVLRGDVVDELEHVHGFADAGAAEQADLATLGERADQVDDLDAGLEQLHRGRELVELRRQLVDRAARVGLDRPDLVDRPAEHVHDAAEGAFADRHRNRRAGRLHLHAPAQAVGGAKRDAAHHTVAELLLDLEGQPFLDQAARGAVLKDEGVVDVGHRLARELDVGNRADALNDGALCLGHRVSGLDGGCAADDF
jgi:peptide chain release factor 1